MLSIYLKPRLITGVFYYASFYVHRCNIYPTPVAGTMDNYPTVLFFLLVAKTKKNKACSPAALFYCFQQ
jgi:hypothetical protein